jgi:transposase
MSLPLHKRYEIVFLSEHPKGPRMGKDAIAKYIGCSKNTVTNWVHKWRKSKDLTDKPKSGRWRSTTAKQDKKIVKLAEKENDPTSFNIQQEMKKKGVNISVWTIRRRLHEAEGKYINKIPKPLLTEKHRKNRLQWAKSHRNFDWNKVIFTDESTFQLNQSIGKAWQFSGKRKIIRTVKHPLKVHVWGCFSASGFGRLICFQRNLNAEFMCNIYEKGLLASANGFFGDGNLDWILQEDNDPKHRSRLATNWKIEKGITVLPWPAMSPDQNPIENVWRIMKIRISKKRIGTTRGLKAELTKEWNQLPRELAVELVNSMKSRVEALIKSNGDYTMY